MPDSAPRTANAPLPPPTAAELRHLRQSGLTAEQRNGVQMRVRACLDQVERHYGIRLETPQVAFDLSGTSAGQYRFDERRPDRDAHRLRFNPYLLAHHFDDSLATTVPHEVAHFAVARLYPRRRLRPHGREWQQVMRLLDASPQVTHRYPVDELEVRRQQRWRYRCTCAEHRVSTTRHNRMQRGTLYLCRSCRQPLILVGPAS